MGRPARYSSEKVLRRKPSGVWEAVWRAPLTGDIKRKTTGKTIEREAQLELIAIKTVSDHPTIADLIDRYIARQDSSGKEIAPIKASLRPVSAFMGTLTADAVTQDHIDDYVLWRRAQKRWEGDTRFQRKDHGNISDSTISKDLRMLRACLNDAASRRYIVSALQFRIPVSEAPPKDDWLTKDEVERLLAECEDGSGREHLAGFILIAITTGARKSEILGLTWDGGPHGQQCPDDWMGRMDGTIQNSRLYRLWVWHGEQKKDPSSPSVTILA
ncbi:MAG: tyrosine-type recombinase/integrase [Octadecabacter sp.]